MRLGIFSDVHANAKAFREVVDDARRMGCERLICLGDVVGYGPEASEALALVREVCDVVVMGNHDSGVAETVSWPFNEYAARGVARHRRELDARDIAWLAGLPHEHHEYGCAFVHGSLPHPDRFEYIVSGRDAEATLDAVGDRFVFVGHVHATMAFVQDVRTRRLGVAMPGRDFTLPPGMRAVVNVGSVGYPRQESASTYCVFDVEKGNVIYRRLPFDLSDYAERLKRRGVLLPDWLLTRK